MLGAGGTQEHGCLVIRPAQDPDGRGRISQVGGNSDTDHKSEIDFVTYLGIKVACGPLSVGMMFNCLRVSFLLRVFV